MQTLICHLIDAVCYVFSSGSLGERGNIALRQTNLIIMNQMVLLSLLSIGLSRQMTRHIFEQLYSVYLECTELIYLEIYEN